uniref:uncharacterized protein LOC122608598 isoform X2 n=1 Tax=Erigeron canadensis TaxID=72917 RepID=UPI001CB8A47F|nr:uncharacterized protein LOC122608598 isoform X2 [Erigeron canadensis]
MGSEPQRFLCSAVIFTIGIDEYYPRVDSSTMRWHQSLVDFSSGKRHNKLRQQFLSSLVHSLDVEDVACALIMLQGSLLTSNPWEKKEIMYLLAMVHYRSGHYLKSMDLVNHCLEIAPRCSKSAYLKSILETCIMEDRVKTILSVSSMIVGVGIGVFGLTSLFSYTWVTEAITTIKDRLKKYTRNPLQLKEEIYLLAQRYCKRGNYSRARFIIDCCLEIDPEWGPALILKKSIESKWCPDLYYI